MQDRTVIPVTVVEHGAFYSCVEGFSPLWRELDGEYVLFDKNSGDMHCFDAVTGAVVIMLQTHRLAVEEISGRLAEMFDVASDDDLARYVANTVSELERREIINAYYS